MRHQRFSILEKQKVVDEIRKSLVQKGAGIMRFALRCMNIQCVE